MSGERVTVAVVGIGATSRRIAGRLLESGIEGPVWNRTRAKLRPWKSSPRRPGTVQTVIELIAAAADAAGVDLAIPKALRGDLAAAERAGLGGRDYSTLVAWLAEQQ